MAEYEIQPLSLCCARSGRQLKPGETYYSVLSNSQDGFKRLDYAADAWAGPPEGAIGFWRSTVPASTGTKKRQTVDESVVFELFEQLAGQEDSSKLNFRYILALLLLRKRILRLTDTLQEADREIWVLRAAATGEEHRVVNPGLSADQLVNVQAEVEKILQSPVG